MVKDRETWCAAVHGVTKSWTRLSDWTTTTIGNLQCCANLCCMAKTQLYTYMHSVLIFFSIMVYNRKENEVTQSCLTLCDPMDCSLPGSSVHGIFQARVLEWVAISFSRRSSWPRDWTRVSHIVGTHFTIWATREVLITGCWIYFPVLYIRTLLLIHSKCNSLHLPTPNSQSIPLSPHPPRQPQVWSLRPWVYFCFVDRFICVLF